MPTSPPLRRAPPFRAALALAAALAVPAPRAQAQALEAATGAALGAAGGLYVSMAVVTANARAGNYVFSPDEVRWQLLPVPIGAAAAGLLGYRSPDRFWRATVWGFGGFAAGSLVGALAGKAIWGDSEGSWSGAVIGGAAGVLAGAVVGTLTWDGDDVDGPAFSLTLPAPW